VRGVIKTLRKAKPGAKSLVGCGYGFIQDEQGKDRFFSFANVVGTEFNDLREGLKVEFEPFEIPEKGLRAESVKVIQ